MSEAEQKNSTAGEDQKEQWITNLTYPCVKCNASYGSKDELMVHYESTRHDQYSSWA